MLGYYLPRIPVTTRMTLDTCLLGENGDSKDKTSKFATGKGGASFFQGQAFIKEKALVMSTCIRMPNSGESRDQWKPQECFNRR